MALRVFSFLPDALIESANAIADYFNHHGYTVKIDAQLDASPAVPTIYAKRNKTEKVALVASKIDRQKLQNWSAYGRSTGRDFRVCCAIPTRSSLSVSAMDFLRKEGVGLLRCDGACVVEELPARDLALTVSLPLLTSLPRAVRKHLGSAYEQFSRTQWREGFEDACQALENLARAYLVAEVKKGRVTQFIRPNGPLPAASDKIARMTLGQLAHAFAQIPNQNQTDAQICQILLKINKDRIGVVHRKNHAATEASLRKNVGMHMWSIISGVKLLA